MRNHFKKLACLFVFVAANATTGASANSFDDFFRAVRGDNAGAVTALIARGFDPNTRDANGQTGLLLALREPSPRVIDALLASPKTNVEARNAKDESPLMLAALKGQDDLVAKLLKRDADVNKPGWTPLHYAATGGQLNAIKVLLENHAFIDAQSPNGTTPLMMAAMYGSADAIKLLLNEGADPTMKNEQGLTAIDFAKRANRQEAVDWIGTAAARFQRQKPASDGKW
ncbi:MAG: hypothetical protein EOP81_08205 [Variovorax sp.]|nr:MAG: hypothetical protein EOP81_08205 [Variovorax sp.]